MIIPGQHQAKDHDGDNEESGYIRYRLHSGWNSTEKNPNPPVMTGYFLIINLQLTDIMNFLFLGCLNGACHPGSLTCHPLLCHDDKIPINHPLR